MSKGLRIGIVSRFNDHQWGGDLKALQSIVDGLRSLQTEVTVTKNIEELDKSDFIFLLNAPVDHSHHLKWLKQRTIPYSVICFWEDFDKYWSPSVYLCRELLELVNKESDAGIRDRIDFLFDRPDHFLNKPKMEFVVKKSSVRPVLEGALFNLANSFKERDVLQKDFPKAKFESAHLSPGMSEDWGQGVDQDTSVSEEFLDFSGLKKGEYVLQVGRIEQRKNQLATLIGCKDLDVTQVFIATKGDQKYYHSVFFKLARTISKAPIVVVSEEYPSMTMGNLRVIKMPPGKLSLSCLKSAYENAAAYVHPAFYESPGYTYLESASLSVPMVASDWSCIGDYFSYRNDDKTLGGLVEYCSPLDFAAIKQATLKQMSFSQGKKDLPPILKRTKVDLARDILGFIDKS